MNDSFSTPLMSTSINQIINSDKKLVQNAIKQINSNPIEIDKENIEPSTSGTKLIKAIKTNPIKQIIEKSVSIIRYTHLTKIVENDLLIKVINIIESYNRFIGLYSLVHSQEIDFDAFIKSLISSNGDEALYYYDVLKALVKIFMQEDILSECLIFNNKLKADFILDDDQCLNQICYLLIKMINEFKHENNCKEKSYLLQTKNETDLENDLQSKSIKDLKIENKINLCDILINTILADGSTYRSNIELLEGDITQLKERIISLTSEISHFEVKKTDLSSQFLIDNNHSLKNDLKLLETRLAGKKRALHNYSRINHIGRIKVDKIYHVYMWRFKSFSKSLIIEKRRADSQTSDWYQVDQIDTMLSILNHLKENQPTFVETIKALETAINQIKSNKDILVNDFKFEIKYASKEPITETEQVECSIKSIISIMNGEDAQSCLRIFVEQLLVSNFISNELIFDDDQFISFRLNLFIVSNEWKFLDKDFKIGINVLKDLMVKIYESIQKRHLKSKFATDLNETWLACVKKSTTSNEIRFLLYHLLKNIIWSHSLSDKQCEICTNDKTEHFYNVLKQACHKCERCFHLQCVLKSKFLVERDQIFDLFKSSHYVVCAKCFELDHLKDMQEIENNKKKHENESKLNAITLNSRTFRLNARANRTNLSESPDKDRSKRKRVHLQEEDESGTGTESESESETSTDEEDEPIRKKSKITDKDHSKRLRESLRPRTQKVNYKIEFEFDSD